MEPATLEAKMQNIDLARSTRVVTRSDVETLQVAVTREAWIPGQITDVFDFVAAEDVLPKF